MPKNFYNLPSPWNPGYAIPKSVMDEGLERRAFVTAQLPRGTYDSVATSKFGYAIPSYVMAEKTGRGTFVTKELPRGYYGPKVPHWLDDVFTALLGKAPAPDGGTATTVATLQGMGDVGRRGGSLANPWVNYGNRSAKAILMHLRKYPKGSQSQVLQTMLDAVEKGLYAKVCAKAAEVARSGVPMGKALEVALSQSMTKGILDELSHVGRTRTAPQPGSLLGLGVYGSLGADKVITAGGGGTYVPPSSDGGTTWNGPAGGGACPNPPTGFTWVPDAGASGGHWGRPKVGEVPQPAPFVLVPPNCTIDTRQGTTGTSSAPQETMIQVGPWVFPDKVGTKLTMRGAAVTPEITNTVVKALVKATSAALAMSTVGGGMNPSDYDSSALNKMFPGGGSGNVSKIFVNGTTPLFRFKHPTTGDVMGLLIGDLGSGDAPGFSVTYIKFNPSALGKLVDALTELIAKIINVVKEIAEAVADAACNALSTPGAAGAAAAASGGAAGAGVVIAGAMCKNGAAPPPILPEAPSLLLPLALGGAALIAIALITKKKKATP